MRRALYAFAVILPLSLMACSEKHVEQGTITAEATLATLETAAYQYSQGKFGNVDQSIVAQIKVYDEDVYTQLVKVRESAQNGQALSTADQAALAAALTAFQTYLTTKGIVTSTSN